MLDKCPDLQFANYDSLRNIDVIWFRETGKQFYPHSAFEVELSTGIWSGVGRLAALREYSTRLFVVSNEHNRFEQVMESQPEFSRASEMSPPTMLGFCILPKHVSAICAAKSEFKYGLPIPMRK